MHDDLISAVWTRRTLRRYVPVWAALFLAAAALDVVLLREAGPQDPRDTAAAPPAAYDITSPIDGHASSPTIASSETADAPSPPRASRTRFGPYVITLHSR